MELNQSVAIVTGGSSGLGEATVRHVVEHGGKAVILDMNAANGAALVEQLGREHAIFVKTDVTNEKEVIHALDQAIEAFGKINLVVNCAGIGTPQKVLSKGRATSLQDYNQIIQVNLVGTFNVIRLAAERMVLNEVNENGERGVIISTASVAAFEGQIGQAAYSASKGGVVAMTLPIARELAKDGIRVMAIAPGLFETPMFNTLPEAARVALGAMTPFPSRLGRPQEYAQLVQAIAENSMLNGEVIRLDGAIRMQPK
ncbi:3-hydroxyacyl-CoA dehydrogenase [Bacillus sp. REN10]|uniref:3-hydroxyacyl-CoA dehydrogenase n=1 Tax=Bacillus sp. REN10 TaxID=2782541 RepID=UPI00193AFF0A|nr:3-hydroxyacyl-CoA dehydrogenase [Bacillus sp. REN10]